MALLKIGNLLNTFLAVMLWYRNSREVEIFLIDLAEIISFLTNYQIFLRRGYFLFGWRRQIALDDQHH